MKYAIKGYESRFLGSNSGIDNLAAAFDELEMQRPFSVQHPMSGHRQALLELSAIPFAAVQHLGQG